MIVVLMLLMFGPLCNLAVRRYPGVFHPGRVTIAEERSLRKRVLSGMRRAASSTWALPRRAGELEELQEENDCYYSRRPTARPDHRIRPHGRSGRASTHGDRWLVRRPRPFEVTLSSRASSARELHCLLSMITPAVAGAATTYKEQLREQTTATPHVRLLDTRSCRRADILMYDAAMVPGGLDQVAHLELTREIARRFQFSVPGDPIHPRAYLTETPKPAGTTTGDEQELTTRDPCSDTAEAVWRKCAPMVTDPPASAARQGEPGVCNVFSYHRILSDEATIAKVDTGAARGIGCIECKKWMYEGWRMLAPVRESAVGAWKRVVRHPGGRTRRRAGRRRPR